MLDRDLYLSGGDEDDGDDDDDVEQQQNARDPVAQIDTVAETIERCSRICNDNDDADDDEFDSEIAKVAQQIKKVKRKLSIAKTKYKRQKTLRNNHDAGRQNSHRLHLRLLRGGRPTTVLQRPKRQLGIVMVSKLVI